MTENSEAIEKPARRPIRRIKIVAGIAVAATQTTMIETGNVARDGLDDSFDPIIPPSVTMTIAPVAEISWHMIRMTRFRSGISRDNSGQEAAHSHTFRIASTL